MRNAYSMMNGVLAAIFLVSFAGATSWSSSTDADFGGFVKRIQGELDRSGGTSLSANIEAERLDLSKLRRAIATGDASQIDLALQNIEETLESAPLRVECEEISARLFTQEQETDKKVMADVDAALKYAQEKVQSATKAPELDEVLQRLSQARDEVAGHQLPAGAAATANKIEPTIQFVASWQDYLADTAIGNVQGATDALQTLTNPSADMPYLIPRSEILARIQFISKPPSDEWGQWSTGNDSTATTSTSASLPTVGKPLTLDPATKTLSFEIGGPETIAIVVKALEDAKGKPEFGEYADSINDMLRVLLPLDQAYQQLKAGLSVDIANLSDLSSENSQKPFQPKRDANLLRIQLIPLRAALVNMAFPRYLGLPPGSAVRAGEAPYDFLKRVETDAIAKNDYLLAARARDAERLLFSGDDMSSAEARGYEILASRLRYGPPGALWGNEPMTDDTRQAQLFVTAHDKDVAGMYSLAVEDYERALDSGSNLVPPEVVGARLTAIKSQHPDDYQRGLQLFLSPAPYGYLPFGRVPGFLTPRPLPNAGNSVRMNRPMAGPSATPAAK
ncbi:MAG: hypothetical protein ABSE62_04540 [Chthoniobacteraceae bacterium]|jgi:enamine deaminase RidA (YjgF/YER057c/UK114 family)